MLSEAHAALVKRDPDIAGLSTLLDPEAFVAALKRQVPEAGIGGAELIHIRYKPGTNCLVSYRIAFGKTTQSVIATAYNPRNTEKIEKRRGKICAPSRIGPGRIVFEELCIVVMLFPNDRRLPILKDLHDAWRFKRVLRELLPTRPSLWDATLHPLKHAPERRYVAKLEAETDGALVKCYRPGAYRIAQRNGLAIRSGERLRTPQVIGASDQHGLLAFEWLDHRDLRSLWLEDSQRALRIIRLVGAALAELHAARIPALPQRTRKVEAEKGFEMAEGIGFIAPRLSPWAYRLAERLGLWLEGRSQTARSIHGDFYAKQVLVVDEAPVIVDFDEAVLGDPLADLGLFIAHAELDRILGRIPNPLPRRLWEALLEGYGTASDLPSAAEVRRYAAVGLFQLAHHPFRNNLPDWTERTAAVLEQAAALSDIGSPKRPKRASDSSPRLKPHPPVHPPSHSPRENADPRQDPKMTFLSQALAPHVAGPLLERLPGLKLKPHQNLIVKYGRVLRYKRHRRCLIEYEVDITRPGGRPPKAITLIAKASAREKHVQSHALSRSLWEGAFGDKTDDGIMTPRPLGLIPEFNMWVQQKVPGTSAAALLMRPDGLRLAERIAEAAYKLHRNGAQPTRTHTFHDELGILANRLESVSLKKRSWNTRLSRILAACHHLGKSLPWPKTCGIHRDFHPDQVIVHGETLYLVDFDLYCHGDPALDIGNFLAHLSELSLRQGGNPNGSAERETALETRYVELNPDVSRQSIQIYKTLTLARHIYISTQFPERMPFTEALIDLCEARLSLFAYI